MNTNNHKHQATVLITGASTGIGFSTAIYLDNLGYKVYAGVRKEDDKLKLLEKAKNGLTPVMLDVCDLASIEKVFAVICEKFKGEPFHLINNAGLSINGPLELLEYSDIKKVIDVNLTGLLIVTKTFLPLIRKNKGRIINISTGHGLLAIPDNEVKDMPGIEAIEVSKIIHKAISDHHPKHKYLIGPGTKKMSVLGKFPAKIRDKMLFKAIYK